MSVSPVTSRPDSRLPSSEFVAVVVIIAIAMAITLYGPLDSMGPRATLAAVVGGSFALGALLAWFVRRRKARQ